MSESEQGTEICDVISILNFKVKTECLCSVSPTELMRAKVLKFFYNLAFTGLDHFFLFSAGL